MSSIIYVGMDVHTTNYTLCCYSITTGNIFAATTMEPDYRNILKYLEQMDKELGGDCHFQCGYEAGCLGYSLNNQLTAHGVDCVILAPTTMATTKKKYVTCHGDRRLEIREVHREHVEQAVGYVFDHLEHEPVQPLQQTFEYSFEHFSSPKFLVFPAIYVDYHSNMMYTHGVMQVTQP